MLERQRVVSLEILGGVFRDAGPSGLVQPRESFGFFLCTVKAAAEEAVLREGCSAAAEPWHVLWFMGLQASNTVVSLPDSQRLSPHLVTGSAWHEPCKLHSYRY